MYLHELINQLRLTIDTVQHANLDPDPRQRDSAIPTSGSLTGSSGLLYTGA